jgi:uncharacterized delta-60 repeat protein
MSKVRLFSVAAAVLALVFATGLSAAAGDLDTTFDGDGKVLTDFAGGSNDWAYAVAVQSDGKAVVAGNIFPADNGTGDSFAVARYSVTGGLDPAFDGDGKVTTEFTSSSFEYATSVAIQADGKIIVAGGVFIPGSSTRSDLALARYNPDGSLDGSFDGDGKVITDVAGGTDAGFSVAVQSDGKIVVAGESRPPGPGRYDFAVARYNQDGSLDSAFDGDGKVVTPISDGSSDYPTKIAVATDGKIVVGGQIAIGAPVTFSAGLVRYLPDGSLDGSFDADGKVVVTSPTSTINDLAVQPDGKIVANGNGFAVARFNANGSVDDTFQGDGNALLLRSAGVSALALQRDGRIVAAGPVGYPASDFAVARFAANGGVDSGFGQEGTVVTDFGAMDIPYGVALAPDGKIVVAGASGPAGGTGPNDFAVARYLAAPPPCKVPNVRGKNLAAARARIKKARCTVGKVARKPSKRAKKGRVLSQSPRAGAMVPSGTKVNLVVSKGRKR